MNSVWEQVTESSNPFLGAFPRVHKNRVHRREPPATRNSSSMSGLEAKASSPSQSEGRRMHTQRERKGVLSADGIDERVEGHQRPGKELNKRCILWSNWWSSRFDRPAASISLRTLDSRGSSRVAMSLNERWLQLQCSPSQRWFSYPVELYKPHLSMLTFEALAQSARLLRSSYKGKKKKGLVAEKLVMIPRLGVCMCLHPVYACRPRMSPPQSICVITHRLGRT